METKLNIHQRLHAVMQAVDYIQKEKKAGMNYTIVSHDSVTAKVRPELVKAGVVYYPVRIDRKQDGNRTEIDMVVRFANVDIPTDFIDVAAIGYGIDNQDKGPGKATSYAVKYALLKALGLETGDDPDNESIPHVKFDARAEGAAIAASIKAAPHRTGLDELVKNANERLALIKQHDAKASDRLMQLITEKQNEFNQKEAK